MVLWDLTRCLTQVAYYFTLRLAVANQTENLQPPTLHSQATGILWNGKAVAQTSPILAADDWLPRIDGFFVLTCKLWEPSGSTNKHNQLMKDSWSLFIIQTGTSNNWTDLNSNQPRPQVSLNAAADCAGGRSGDAEVDQSQNSSLLVPNPAETLAAVKGNQRMDCGLYRPSRRN